MTSDQAPKKPRPKVRITRPPTPARRETLITDVLPIFSLKFYPGAIVAMRRVGRRWSEYFVDAAAIRQELVGTPVSTGMLDRNTLATGVLEGMPFTVVLIPPRKVTVGVRGGAKSEEWSFTTPPIVWAGWQETYRIYALHARDLVRGWPKSAAIPLYHAPFANTYASGSICWGSGRRPGVANPAAMAAGFTIYAEDSFFIEIATSQPSKQFGGDVSLLYGALSQLRAYPCDDLRPQGEQLSHVLGGKAFDDSL